MNDIVWLVVGYIVGAYLMRRHMLQSLRARAEHEVFRAMREYERDLLSRLSNPAACDKLRP